MSGTIRQDKEIDIGVYLQLLRRRRWIMLETFGVVLGVGVLATVLATPIYRTTGKLLVEASSSQVTTVNTENPLVGLLALAEPDSISTQLQVLQSGPFLDEVFRQIGYRPEPGSPSPSVQVEALEDTNIIQVTSEAADPKVAADVVNGVLELHVEKTNQVSLREIRKAKEFVAREAGQAQRALTAAENALSLFKRDHHVTQIAAEQNSVVAQMGDLEKKGLENDYKLAGVQARLDLVTRRLAAVPAQIVRRGAVENPRRNQLRGRIADLKLERALLARSYRPNSSRLVTLDWQLAEMEKQFQAEPATLSTVRREANPLRENLAQQQIDLSTQLEGLRAEQKRLKAHATLLRGRSSSLGPWEARLAQLNRERDMAQASYLVLASKLQDLGIREEARRSTARVIQRASAPSAPVRPRKSVNILFCVVVGLTVAVGMALLQERLDDRIKTPEDLERLLTVPVLGQIPFVQEPTGGIIGLTDMQTLVQNAYRAGWSLRQIAAIKEAQTLALEAYRAARTSITFSAVDTHLRSLVITSSIAGEGKTRTATNLACAMALEGKQVVLVDADLRRPTVHRVLELPNVSGLTDCLVDLEHLSFALQQTENSNLRILTSGPLPPNPAEMLNSAMLRQLRDRLLEEADIVIFDAAPCVPVIDSRVLSAHVDGVVLVAAMDGVRRRELNLARLGLEQVRAPLLGVIANKVRVKASSSYTYYGRTDTEAIKEPERVPVGVGSNGLKG